MTAIGLWLLGVFLVAGITGAGIAVLLLLAQRPLTSDAATGARVGTNHHQK